MNLFFTKNIENGIAQFDEEEARHLIVLRKKLGDTIHFTDGEGFFYDGKIMDISKKNVVIRVENERKEVQNKAKIHIAIAPTKNIDRIEWFLEKATEIGISEITFLLCDNSERERIRLDRLQNIALSAMKQSLQATLPVVNDLIAFKQFIKNQVGNETQKLIAYCNDEHLSYLPTALSGSEQLILIGPEGDFSSKEIDLAKSADYQGVSLGKNRLRTETAALFAVVCAQK